jgi:lipoprotein-anchoring transpeptidase ErfK/SrfK
VEAQDEIRKIEKKPRSLFLGLFFVVLLISAAASSLFCYQYVYAEKIYPNVYLGDNRLSGLTKKQAYFLLQKHYGQILNREITLIAGNKKSTINLSKTGISFDVNQVINDAYQVGRADAWEDQLVASSQTLWKKEAVAPKPKINKSEFESFKDLIVAQLNQESRDASLEIKDGEVVISPEIDGQEVDISSLADRLVAALADPSLESISIEVTAKKAKASSKDFGQSEKFAKNILAKKIDLTYENFSFTPNKEELSSWIRFDNNEGKITAALDDDQIKTYLNQISSRFEIQKVTKKVNALDDSVIVEGKAGKYLNKDDALNKIKESINKDGASSIALVTYTQEPSVEKVIPSEGLVPGRFSGKYIDVDITQQRLCLVDGSNIGNCYVVSTGKWSTPTPTGTRLTENKSPKAWSARYGLWMPWWQGLGGGYGIHELPEWPSGYKEGENHLGTPVSHGCIRLGVGSAEEVYNWAPVGTPVYIHK